MRGIGRVLQYDNDGHGGRSIMAFIPGNEVGSERAERTPYMG